MPTYVTLGHEAETGQPVILDANGRKLSTYVIGMQGTGKSTLLEHIARQDIANGDGLCFIDPHGDSAETLLSLIPRHRVNDVIFWDVSDQEHPFGLNPLYCRTADEIDNCGDDFIDALQNLREYREVLDKAVRVREILSNLATTFALNPGSTLCEAPKFLANNKYRESFYGKLSPHYPQVHEFWLEYDKGKNVTHENVGSAINKVSRFQSNRHMRAIFGQKQTSIDFRRAMDEGKIVIVKMTPQIRENNAALIGTFIIWEISRAVDSRQDTDRQFHLIVDEFSRFMTNLFPRLLTQSRKQGIDVTVAHQNRDQITNDEIAGSTLGGGNKVVLRVSGKDSEVLAKEADHTPPPGRIIGERPILTLATDPLAFIARSGHRSELTEPLVTKVQSMLIRHGMDMEEYNNDKFYTEGFMTGNKLPANSYMKKLLECLRAYLYRRMSGQTDVVFMDKNTAMIFSSTLTRRSGIWKISIAPPYGVSTWWHLMQNLNNHDHIHKLQEAFCWAVASYQRLKQGIDSLEKKISKLELDLELKQLLCGRSDEEKKNVLIYTEALENTIPAEVSKVERAISNLEYFATYEVDRAAQIALDYEEYYLEYGDRYGLDAYRTHEVTRIIEDRNKKRAEIITSLAKTSEYVNKKNKLQRLEEARKCIEGMLRESYEYLRELGRCGCLIYNMKDCLEMLKEVYDDVNAVMQLGDVLAQYPIRVPSGEYEPIYDRERPFSDVANQVANTLKQLPKFSARVIITREVVRGGKPVSVPVENTIEILGPVEPKKSGVLVAKAIKALSRRKYGADRDAVEEAIRQRLGSSETTSSVHSKGSAPVLVSAAGASQSDEYGDDEPLDSDE